MSEAAAEGVLQQIDRHLADLASAERQLKKPSTISFAERRDLSTKAARAAATLRDQRAEVEAQGEPAADAELPDALKSALADAEKILSKIDAAQPAGLNRKAGPNAAKLPGQSRRGSGGMSSQQRPPDRIGE